MLLIGIALGQHMSNNAPTLSGEHLIDSWTSEQGLPQNSIHAIGQTPDGYLWLATQGGLIRFDGRSFMTFNQSNTPDIGQDWINTLVVSEGGTLWFGVYASGLTSYRDGVFRTYSKQDGLPDDNIAVLCAVGENEIWTGTRDAGIGILRNGTFSRIDTASGLPSNSILSIFHDRDGTTWVGTTKGLAALSARGWRTYRMADGLPDDRVEAIHQTADGTLYFGTRKGLAMFKSMKLSPAYRQDQSPPRISAIHSTRSNDVWIGIYVGGVLRIEGDAGQPVKLLQDETPTVLALCEDREGSLWVGTDGFGLFRIREARVRSLTAPIQLSTGSVWSACEISDGSIWIGTDGKGIDRLSRNSRTSLSTKNGLPGDIVFSLQTAPDNSIWIGTDQGLARYLNGRMETYTSKKGYPFSRASVIHVDRHGIVWVAETGLAVGRYDGKRWTYLTKKDGLPKMFGTCLLLDRNDVLWIGSDAAGVAAYSNGQITQHSTDQGLSSNIVSCLFQDSLGGIWVGTYGGGLSRFEGGRWATVTTKNGLAEDITYSIQRDEVGMIWLSGNAGLYRVSERDLIDCAMGRVQTVKGILLTQFDGMPSGEGCGGVQPASLKSRDGRLWFPTVRGIAVVDPGSIRVNTVPPSVVIQNIRAEREPISVRDHLEVGPGVRDLDFEYTGLSYIVPQYVTYRYRLDGYDRDWINAGNRHEAYYTGLIPGNYVFRVQAANADGVWNEAGVVLPITLNAMWYQTWWFYSLIVVLVVSSGYGAYRMRVRQLLRHEEELERRVDEALANMKVLGGLIPICANCKKIRDDKGYWNNLERYIHDHSEAKFSHSLCPDCMQKLYGDFLTKDETTGKFVSTKKKQ